MNWRLLYGSGRHTECACYFGTHGGPTFFRGIVEELPTSAATSIPQFGDLRC